MKRLPIFVPAAVVAWAGTAGCAQNHDSIVAWGYHAYGQRIVPEPNAGFAAVAGGSEHSPGLKAGDACYPDFRGDGVLDPSDSLGYVNTFNAGENVAGCDGNGPLDLFDFLCFMNAFNVGVRAGAVRELFASAGRGP